MSEFLKINRESMEEQIKKFSDYPEVSDYQAEMMLHALGADHKAFRKGKNGKTFHAFRNRFVPGEKDICVVRTEFQTRLGSCLMTVRKQRIH